MNTNNITYAFNNISKTFSDIANEIRTSLKLSQPYTYSDLAPTLESNFNYVSEWYNIINKTISEFDAAKLNISIYSLWSHAFVNCKELTSVNLPGTLIIGSCAFYTCTALSSISLPNVTTIGHSAFRSCTNLSSIDLPNVTTIGAFVFANCIKLMSIYLLGSSVCYMSGRTNTYQTASASNVFSNTPILDSTLTGSFGSIYVPSSLVSEYRNNWNLAFTVRFVGV